MQMLMKFCKSLFFSEINSIKNRSYFWFSSAFLTQNLSFYVFLMVKIVFCRNVFANLLAAVCTLLAKDWENDSLSALKEQKVKV